MRMTKCDWSLISYGNYHIVQWEGAEMYWSYNLELLELVLQKKNISTPDLMELKPVSCWHQVHQFHRLLIFLN